jgi:hypothetical protein
MFLFQWLDSFSVLSWAPSIELVPTSWHQIQHKTGCINQTQNINRQWVLRQTFTWGLAPMVMQILTVRVHKFRALSKKKANTKDTNSVRRKYSMTGHGLSTYKTVLISLISFWTSSAFRVSSLPSIYVVVWGTMLQAGRSRVRFPMR